MKILVTEAKDFLVGKNLVANLYNINGKECTRDLKIEDIFEYDMNSQPEELETDRKECDFVFNFAGVNLKRSIGVYGR